MTQEALKLALDALESAVRYHGVMFMSDPPQDAWKYHRVENKVDKAITAIKEALAQTQEPVAHIPLKALEQIKPPMLVLNNVPIYGYSAEGTVAVYTTPPQRTWVGLTDEEIDSYFEDHGWSPSKDYYPVIKAIEAKLKQKNGYAEENT